jgi:hypothetical protein
MGQDQSITEDKPWDFDESVVSWEPETLELLKWACVDEPWDFEKLKELAIKMEPVVDCAKMLKYLGIDAQSVVDCETMLKYLGVDADPVIMITCMDG